MDGRGRLRLVEDGAVVVVPDTAVVAGAGGFPGAAEQRRLHDDGRCRWPRPCAACDEELRAEAIAWLRGLADDYFGYGFVEAYTSGQFTPEIQILWRDPLGVTRLADPHQLQNHDS